MKTLLFSLLIAIAPAFAKTNAYVQVPDTSQLTIESPNLQSRQTAKLKLANGMHVYIISDPGVKESAASVAVNVGSWSDPNEYPGMAHFLEHMLFMGNDAYPEEFEFSQFVKDNGGTMNAYTSFDRTVYMFSANNDAFEGALDRFSHFFIDPLFAPSAINRELLAVDQEHAKNIQNDPWRHYMIFKETGNPDHPNAKFSTGNAKTLGGIPREAMMKWYADHYSADKMYLVIYSALPLDELKEMVINKFSPVSSHSTPLADYSSRLSSEKQRGSAIHIKPIKDIKVLSLTWEIPGELYSRKAHVGQLLSYVLQRGSNNSLLGYLKRHHLAQSISVSEECWGPKSAFFTIDVKLTDQGVQDVERVTQHCFEALARLKSTGIPRYVYDEVERISTLKYNYQSRQNAFTFVQEHSARLIDEDLSSYPRETLLPTEYNPELIKSYLNCLTPKECIVFVMADPELTGVAPKSHERWMGAEYTVQPLSQATLEEWASVRFNPQIGLPPPNPYIPKSFELVHVPQADAKPRPKMLADSAVGKVYFAPDESYQLPEVAYLFRFKSPFLDGSAKGKALADLVLLATSDALFPTTSAAEVAGFNISMNHGKMGISLAITGFSDTANALTETLFSEFKKMRPTKEQFEIYKRATSSSYANAGKELPIVQCLSIAGNVLYNDAPTPGQKRLALESISYDEFQQTLKTLTDRSYTEALLYGNITIETASELWNDIQGTLKSKGFPVEDHPHRQVLALPRDKGPFMIVQPTEMQGHAALLIVEQGPYTFAKRACQQVLDTVLSHAFFETLRTKQQTAYIAKSWTKEEEGVLLQLFAVQSSTHTPGELIARFELFVEEYLKNLGEMVPEERFETIRAQLIKSLERPPENLPASALRLFQLGFEYNDFDFVDKRIKALEEMSYQGLFACSNAFLSRNNTRRVAILMEGVSPYETEFRYELVSADELKSDGQYVAWEK